MLTDERHNFIRAELALKGRVFAGALAERFGVSEDTARRDLRELAKDGVCRRVYGGALAPSAGSLGERNAHLRDEKFRLAQTAVKLIRPGQTLFIDSGSTNIAIANAIAVDMELTVATNSLGVAMALADHKGIKLVVFGGPYNRDLGICSGAETLSAISQMNADLLFLGSCGVDAFHGATAFNSVEAEIKRAMVKNSMNIVVAATSEKLSTSAPFHVVGPKLIRHLVVAQPVSASVLSKFKRQGATIHLA